MSSFQPEFALTQWPVRVRFGPGVRHDIAAEVERLGADCLVAIGGGSTVGLAKALALRTDLPQIVLPTTYAGSEATPVLGETEGGRKTTLTDPRVLPEVILYDAELVVSLPVGVSVSSALNAMAHAAEALYARERNPVSTLLALEGLRAFKSALPGVIEGPDDLGARGETLYGAWACGTVLGQVGMALHHKLAHVLGGAFELPHAETHAVLLPHTVGFNAPAAPDRLGAVAAILGGETAGAALFAFARRVGAPRSLRDLGLGRDQLGRAADLAMEAAYWNPRPFGRADILGILEAAWTGAAPGEG